MSANRKGEGVKKAENTKRTERTKKAEGAKGKDDVNRAEGTKKAGKGRWRKVLRINRRAFGLMCRESGGYTALLIFRDMLGVCMPYWGLWFSARLLDEIIGDRSPRLLILYTVLLLSGYLVLRFLWEFISALESQKRFEFTQKEFGIFTRKAMELDYSLLEEERVHVLYKQVVRESFNDGKNLETLRRNLPWLISTLVGMGLSVAMVWELLVKMWDYGLVAVLFVLLAVGGIWVSTKCGAATSRTWLECNRSIGENCVERDGYLDYFNQYERGKEIRIYQIGRLMIDRLLATHHFNDRALDRRTRRSIPLEVVSGFAEEATMAMIYCLTGFAALMGRITLGSMTQYIGSIQNFIENMRICWSCLTTLWFNGEYLERYFEFLDTPSQMRKGCLPVEKRMDGEYKIRFEHVSFRYPGSDRYALKDIDMEFRIGEKMAVVGMNGSGKTTFIKLLCRLYDPTEGVIYMNGIDIRRYDYQEYMSLFSVVFQDFKLFSFTLGENVAVAEDYEEDTVREALRRAGMGDFLETHEKQLSTVLYRDFDRDGVEISGGEAQKIALARAVCKGAPFVLLDEPTAALDPLAEYEIYKRFNELVADRTTVYISHRMSSCRFCGDIAVFHEGQVVQRGNHESLMAEKDGKYYELWTSQAQYYQKEK